MEKHIIKKRANKQESDSLEELNSKAIELMNDDKLDQAINILKKAESMLESFVLKSTNKIDKKLLFIIIHNIACCYQKLKDFENCILYLEAVIFHFDSQIENKYSIKINEQYFSNLKNSDYEKEEYLGDMILQLRFSAKFHLQMCAVLSQANNHLEAIKHAKLASYLCEDNVNKTCYLFNQIQGEYNAKKNNSNYQLKDLNGKLKNMDFLNNQEDFSLFENKIRDSYTIINYISVKIKQFRKNLKINNDNEKIYYENNSEDSIKELKATIKKILENKASDDWTNLLNIGNIMYLSALNLEDMELDSDPKFELMRDALIEKIIMLTVAHFCVATELRFLSDVNEKAMKDSEIWHYNSILISTSLLSGTCPIVKHYISSYYKNYSNSILSAIPEDKSIDYNIEFIRCNYYDEDDLTIILKTTEKEIRKRRPSYREEMRLTEPCSKPDLFQKTITSKTKLSLSKEKEILNSNFKNSKTRNYVSTPKYNTSHLTFIQSKSNPYKNSLKNKTHEDNNQINSVSKQNLYLSTQNYQVIPNISSLKFVKKKSEKKNSNEFENIGIIKGNNIKNLNINFNISSLKLSNLLQLNNKQQENEKRNMEIEKITRDHIQPLVSKILSSNKFESKSNKDKNNRLTTPLNIIKFKIKK